MFYSIMLFLNISDGQVVAECVLTALDYPINIIIYVFSPMKTSKKEDAK